MSRTRVLVGASVAAIASTLLTAVAASAANGPTFRDCSLFVAGVDPDFVELSGVTVGPEGGLTVPFEQKQVGVLASESSDPGDSEGHVTLRVTITTPHVKTVEVSGAGTGKVMLAPALRGTKHHGRKYTISWSATFDNGNHLCPSENTPENTTPKPFIVTMS
jgi:hypothetical protein